MIGDYNYLFDPVVHLKRFFDTSGDWLFLIDEAHNLPDRARAMYSARFCKSSLTDAKRTLGKGKSALKTALTKADKAMREARQACVRLAPRRHAEDAPGEPAFCRNRIPRRLPCRSRCMRRTARCFCRSCPPHC